MTLRRRLLRYGVLTPVVALALVVLLSQTLGLLHGIVHVPSLVAGSAAHAAPVPGAAVAAAEFDHAVDSFASRLFSGHSSHDGDPECRLYDQSSHFDAMPGVPVLALPLVLQPSGFSVLAGLAVARWHALFQARGPPRVR